MTPQPRCMQEQSKRARSSLIPEGWTDNIIRVFNFQPAKPRIHCLIVQRGAVNGNRAFTQLCRKIKGPFLAGFDRALAKLRRNAFVSLDKFYKGFRPSVESSLCVFHVVSFVRHWRG